MAKGTSLRTSSRNDMSIRDVVSPLFIVLLLSIACFIPATAQESDDQFLDSLEYQTFLFFYENTDARGFTIESTAWPIGSSASSGFYLTSIPIAIERGWITYDEGYERVLNTLNSYYDDPADPHDFYVECVHGFFPHWFNQDTGKWNGIDCYSSIDTAILMAGVLTVRPYFADTEIEQLATKLYEAVDWAWMLNGGDTLSMGWRPDTGFLAARWQGYNEGMLAVLLAIGSPTHPIPEVSWDAWTSTYNHVEYTHQNERYKFVESTSTSLFTYQYPHIWFDFRGKADKRGINYFLNSFNATRENRAYCLDNPNHHRGYGQNAWGLTACECPRHTSNYGAHGPRQDDDGTIAPTGAGGSIIFTPVESIAALHYMKDIYGSGLWGKYGFKDAFNPDLEWFSPTYIGIDQGALLTMLENYRSGLVQGLCMQNECAKRAMQKAGFTRVDTTPPTITRIQEEMDKITVNVQDNTGVQSVVLHMNLKLGGATADSTIKEASRPMTRDGKRYFLAGVQTQQSDQLQGDIVLSYYIEAADISGNIARTRTIYPGTNQSPKGGPMPLEFPSDSLLVDNFDDCMSKHGAGAWHGGSSTPEDCVLMFDRSVNHGTDGCSMKIRYNVMKAGAYNGIWIRLNTLDLRNYGEIVFWLKGDKNEGYTDTFKIELKDSSRVVVYVVKGVTGDWGEITIPLNKFTPPEWSSGIDWSAVNEMTLVFEDGRVTDKDGALYLDDIYFTKKTPVATAPPTRPPTYMPATTTTPTTPPFQTPSPNEPGFDARITIAGLIAIACLIKRKRGKMTCVTIGNSPCYLKRRFRPI
jgi:hypothetical protein